jgi:hypothetical protein
MNEWMNPQVHILATVAWENQDWKLEKSELEKAHIPDWR